MLWVVRLLARSRAVEGAHGAPLRKLALCLGAGCGAAGYFVMRRLGGDPARHASALLDWRPGRVSAPMLPRARL